MRSFRSSRAFTIVELLVAMTVTLLLVGLLASITDSTSKAWQQGSTRAETFTGARSALSLIGRELQGAVIDLDLGYMIQKKDLARNDYALKFLTRRQPTADEPSGIQKVAYQLAWASRDLLPELSERFDAGHPIPVLIRTVDYEDSALQDVFDITSGKNPWDWVDNWPTDADIQDPTKTEVVAENILGWEVNPVYFDDADDSVVIDNPDSDSEISYVDDGSAAPRYITSDLKYVKLVQGMEDVPASSGPRAIQIRLAAVPSSILPRLTEESALGSVRAEEKLFDPYELSDSVFGQLLKKDMRIFDATYYLSSKTP